MNVVLIEDYSTPVISSVLSDDLELPDVKFTDRCRTVRCDKGLKRWNFLFRADGAEEANDAVGFKPVLQFVHEDDGGVGCGTTLRPAIRRRDEPTPSPRSGTPASLWREMVPPLKEIEWASSNAFNSLP